MTILNLIFNKRNAVAFVTFFLSLQLQAAPKQIWIYTSIYKEFAEPIKKAFEANNPDTEVQIFQGGSEKIQAKVEAELIAQKPQADVILTSDAFWSADLGKRNLAHSHKGKLTETNYHSLMILVAHKDLPLDQRPKSFSDLTKPQYKNLIQTGSPLESGTMFSTVAYLSRKYGWDYFKKLRENNVASSGGNSTVIQKIESGEKKVGWVLLENALASQKRGSPIEIIYPIDGAIPIPSVQVILKDSKQKETAEKFAEFILSKEGQELLRNGFMYSVRKDVTAPEGAKPIKEVTKKSTPWTDKIIAEVAADAKNIKKQFSLIILE
ncbi:MAG: extracellular solute-binding protein [Oligoflexia bacterium]|nr:extracellular solute-binding protein [Oligoflexia bacterium]